MLFTDIRLQNFRSHLDSSFEIGPGVTIVVGPNTAGKTNLLEALILAAQGSSYKDNDTLISFGQDWARIDVHTSANTVRTVKLRGAEQLEKEIEVAETAYKRLPARHKHPVVLFEPNDLQLLHGEPSGRREFVDRIIGSMDEGYQTLMRRYKRTLAQRNSLLKADKQRPNELFVWNVRLVELAHEIVMCRQQLVKELEHRLPGLYSLLAGQQTNIQVRYKSSIPLNTYSSSLLKQLEKDSTLDYRRGFTGHGPHRDDIVFLLDGHDASSQASRGEVRTIMLAFKIIEMELLEKHHGIRPLLLLDDVFSELDGARRRSLTTFLDNTQTVITTTDADVVIKHFSKKCTVIPLQKNQNPSPD